MQITILSLFPEMIEKVSTESILGRAQKSGTVVINGVNLRQWGLGRRHQVDDTPYGGGAGMVLKVDVMVRAIRELKNNQVEARVILMTPQGKKFSQAKANELSREKGLILIAGHYEGFDERIRDYVDEEISIGDYILTGGELPAMVVADAVARLLPGALGKDESAQDESFTIENQDSEYENLIEYPHYTRPEEYEGRKVPQILLSGNHAEIKKWRLEQSKLKTKKRRPDLLK